MKKTKQHYYKVIMTIEQWVEAQDEDEAKELAKQDFDYSDLHYAELNIEETSK